MVLYKFIMLYFFFQKYTKLICVLSFLPASLTLGPAAYCTLNQIWIRTQSLGLIRNLIEIFTVNLSKANRDKFENRISAFYLKYFPATILWKF